MGAPGADVLGLLEPNIPSNRDQSKDIRQVSNSLWRHSKFIHGNCPPDDFFDDPDKIQPGGALQLIHGSHNGRIFKYDADYLGRWVTQVLRLKDNRSLAILTAYRPGTTSVAASGDTTIIKQQFRALRRRGVVNPNPRKLFLKDLEKHVLSLMSDGHAILLGMDANLSPSDPDYAAFLDNCDLHDLIATRHPESGATHTKGNRLDVIIGCEFVLDNLVAVGVLDDSYGTHSDHAMLYADLHNRIFNKKIQDPTSATQRGFNLNDKKKVAEFQALVTESLESNDRLAEIETLLETTTDLTLLEQLCNDMDEILTATVLRAESKVRRKIENMIPWSLEFKQARDAAYVWNKHLRTMQKTREITVPLPSHVPITYQDALSFVQRQVTAAWKKVNDIKRHAFEHRIDFLRGQVKSHDDNGDTEKAAKVRKILDKEVRRETYRKLSRLLKGSRDAGLSKILRPNFTGQWEEITEMEELFQVLLERNKKHFAQANETTLAHAPHSTTLPPFDHSTTYDEILAGDLDSFDNLPAVTKSLLQEMERSIDDEISSDITLSDFKDGMKKATEGKASSMSGRHYGIYKALLPVDRFTSNVVSLINCGVTHGFILKRWRKVLQVMLLKKTGVYRIDKLRVIQLIEADLNMYFRLVWGKRLVRHTHNRHKIPCEQFGSVPGAMAMSAALLKVLSFDLIRLLRVNATIFNNDATACYDRILPVLSQICCERLGLPNISAKFKLEFLRAAQYYIKTQHGISDDWFGNAISEVYGVLQGSGAAPAIWLSVSIVLINTYNQLFRPDGIPNPTAADKITKIIDAFVDDTDLWDVLFGEQLDDDAAIARMQHRSATWEKIMFSAGGRLNLAKCYWYYVKWNWHNGLPELATIADCPGTITLSTGFLQIPATITRIEATDALATLGLWSSPSGQNTKQLDEIKTPLRSSVRRLNTVHLRTDEADLLLPVYLIPKLGYIYAGSTFDYDTCCAIDRIFLPTIKSKMGYNRKTKLCVLHGSYLYGGGQLATSWDCQGSIHLNLLLGHLQLRDVVGQHLLHCMDYLYLGLGFRAQVMTYDIGLLLSLAPHCWITNTWDYLSSINATLISLSLVLHPQRVGDVTIMELATLHYKGISLRRINSVRLYLKVFFLSDITSADGTNISKEYRKRNQPLQRTSLLVWPNQAEPGPKAWSEWLSMLRKCHTDKSFVLRNPLGAWLTVPHRTQSWHTLIDPTTTTVYVQTNSTWHIHRPVGRAKTTLTYIEPSPTPPPAHSLPVTVLPKKKNSPYLRLFPYVPTQPTTLPPTPMSTTFPQLLRQLPPHEKWTIGHVMPQYPEDLAQFLYMIRTGDFVLGSDGSVRGQLTTYSSRIQSKTDLHTFITSHSKAEPTSTLRVEAYGYLGTLYLLRAAITFLLQQGYIVEIPITHQYMDNDGVLKRLKYGPATTIKHHLNRHSDVIREIQSVEASLPFPVRRHHVSSHQYDDIEDLEDLPLPSRVNRMADTACTFAHDCPTCRSVQAPPIYPSTTAHVLLRHQPYSSKLAVDFRHAYQDKLLRAYIKEKEQWTDKTFDSVHWPNLRLCRYRSTGPQRRSALKLMFKLWATNHALSQRSNTHDHRCERCQQLNEDWTHIFRCRHSELPLAMCLTGLREYMRKKQVAAVMINCILHGIETFLRPTTSHYDFSQHPQDTFLHLVRRAYVDQTQIGWSNFLRGRHATMWLKAHDHYHSLRHLHDRYSSTHLGPNLILRCWDFCRRVWMQRNKDVKGENTSKTKDILLPKLNRKIEQAFADPSIISDYDQAIVYRLPLATILAKPLRSKLKWYSLYQACLTAPDEPLEEGPAPPPRELHDFFLPYAQLLHNMQFDPQPHTT